MAADNLKIGELASQTGASVVTIRYYEQQNLPPPPARTESNYWLYGEAHVKRLQFIRLKLEKDPQGPSAGELLR